MRFVLHKCRVESALEHVTEAVVRLVEHVGVPTADRLHALRQISARSFEKQMKVVVHQAVGKAVPPAPDDLQFEEAQKQLAILIGQEDVVPSHTAVGDVRDGVGRKGAM
jgi:hypothetical protein